MMNAAKRFSVVRSCRVGLSFGTGDSNLLVCGLLYIPGSLSFFPSEKSPRAVFSCGAMKPSFPPPGPPGAVTGQCPSQAVCPAGRDRITRPRQSSSLLRSPIRCPLPVLPPCSVLRLAGMGPAPKCALPMPDAACRPCVRSQARRLCLPSSPGNGRLSVWRPDSKKLRLFPLFCQASGEPVRNSTGFSKTGLSDGKM